MPLLKDGVAISDPWRRVADGEPIPESEPALIPFARWKSERAALIGRNAPVGVILANTQDLAELAADLGRFDLIALEFPKFVDGRAFTQARLLRERYGYKNELRATGNVLRDQLQFMRRCGFDAVEMGAPDAAEQWRVANAEIDIFYQPAADRAATAIARRHSA